MPPTKGSEETIAPALQAELTAEQVFARGGRIARDGARRSVSEWLRFPEVPVSAIVDDHKIYDARVFAELVEDARYAPYLQRQARDVAERARAGETKLPGNLPYAAIPGLSTEMIERLGAARPATLDAASRVRGVSPAALSAILLHVKRLAA